MNQTSIVQKADPHLPVVIGAAPGPDGKQVVSVLRPYNLKEQLERAMSSAPGGFLGYAAKLPRLPRAFRNPRTFRDCQIDRRAQLVIPTESYWHGTPMGDAIAAEASRRESEFTLPWVFWFWEFGTAIVVLIPVPRAPVRYERHLRRELAGIYRQLADACGTFTKQRESTHAAAKSIH